MIILTNTSQNPFIVQYVYGEKVFRKQIMPNAVSAFKHLTNVSQIKNQQSLTGNSIGIYDYTNSVYINQGSFATGYKGATAQSGLSFYTSLLTVPTGYTFITSANTVMANNTVSATSVGNSFRIALSGNSISTGAWYGALLSTSFSGMGITIKGMSSSAYVSTGTTTISLSSDTVSSNVNYGYFIGDDVKPSDYTLYNAFDLNATYTSLSALI